VALRLKRRATGRNSHLATEFDAYRLLVDSLFSSPASMIVSNIIGTLVPLYCWSVSHAPAFIWLTWTAAAISALRIITLVQYRRQIERATTISDIARWDREYFLGATAMSVTLGVGNFIALAWTDIVSCHIITIVCSIAFASGYVARNAGRLKFVIVQVLCFTIPMCAGLVLATDPLYEVIAAYIASYAVTNIIIAFSLNRNLLQLAAANKESAQLADSIQQKNQTLDSALNAMTHGLCMLSRDLSIKVVNARFLDMYRLTAHDTVMGTTLAHVLSTLVRSQILTAATALDLVQLCERAATQDVPVEREIVIESGQTFIVFVDRTPDGGMLLLTEDATARKAAAQQIERMARCDLLTDLPNRFRFNEVLAERLTIPNHRLALIYVDLDDFKTVNDTMGHEAGDQLLVQVAARLKEQANDELVARFGGDEFLLLKDIAQEEEAMALAWRILAAVAEPFTINGTEFTVTTSIGIAISPDHATESSDLLRSADVALYAAKSDGRNTVVLYTRALSDALHHRREMENDLREAVRCGRLCLHYQPIVDARTDQVRSYEALMRWQHPTKGMIPPGDFIPIAEQIGLIAQMGAWALRQACLDARKWPDRIGVAVNVSANQFKDASGFIENVKDALLISGLDPGRLELEVTESLLIVNQEATLNAIRALRRLGVRFSLDDFGNGYSSLGYIARYPFSKVKIDRSFAEHLTTDNTSRSIIEVVCQLAVKLDMKVVVEGIETEAQRREIVALGAEQAQGWLFGRPLPMAEIVHSRASAAG
jgi:diguanylate cyclase (GGDEF)-like protein